MRRLHDRERICLKNFSVDKIHLRGWLCRGAVHAPPSFLNYYLPPPHLGSLVEKEARKFDNTKQMPTRGGSRNVEGGVLIVHVQGRRKQLVVALA